MPIYEYRRPDGSTFEVVQSFSDEALTSDPQTGVKVERVLHAPAVHFKGSGFYNTDYGPRKRQRESVNESAGGGPTESKSPSDGASANGKEGGFKRGLGANPRAPLPRRRTDPPSRSRTSITSSRSASVLAGEELRHGLALSASETVSASLPPGRIVFPEGSRTRIGGVPPIARAVNMPSSSGRSCRR